MSDLPPPQPEPEDYDLLGAAPTVPVSGGAIPKVRRVGRGIRVPGAGDPLRRVAIVVIVVLVLAFLPTALSTLKKTPRNMVGISYGGGPFESAHFQRIVMPGSNLFFNGWFDPLYLYPADTQSYVVSLVPNQGSVKTADSIIAPSKDRVPITYQVAVYFRLNIDRLRQFHETLGLQYGAYKRSGWSTLIQYTFRQQLENALQEETRRFDVSDIYSNADVLDKIQSDVQSNMSQRLVSALGQQFFCGPTYKPGGNCTPPTFQIKRIDIPSAVVQAFQDNRTSQIQIQTAQNTVLQRQAEAQAIEALNVGLSQAGMNYVLLRAIETGKITFWVVPDGTGLTLQAPGAGGLPTTPTTTPPSTTSTTTSSTTSTTVSAN